MYDIDDIFRNKHEFKQRVQAIGIRVPKTLGFTDDYDKWAEFWKCTETVDSFVMKPNHLSCGEFIYIVQRRNGRYYEIDGTELSQDFLEDVGFQILSQNLKYKCPAVLIEECLKTHKSIRDLYGVDKGIADIRLFVQSGNVIGGWLRAPTALSRYYSNCTRGATAFFLSRDGEIVHGVKVIKVGGDDRLIQSVTGHPDTGKQLKGEAIPFWGEMKSAAERVSGIFHIDRHTVDMTVNEKCEVVVIEGEVTPFLRMCDEKWKRYFGY